MDILNDLLLNYYFLAFAIAWLLSILIKIIVRSVQDNKLNIKSGFENGGMPSSHSAVVSAITAAVFIMSGFSELFFVCVVFSLIIINDAFVLRYNVGLQCQALNTLLEKSDQKALKVVRGHTALQVSFGVLLGILVAAALYLVL